MHKPKKPPEKMQENATEGGNDEQEMPGSEIKEVEDVNEVTKKKKRLNNNEDSVGGKSMIIGFEKSVVSCESSTGPMNKGPAEYEKSPLGKEDTLFGGLGATMGFDQSDSDLGQGSVANGPYKGARKRDTGSSINKEKRRSKTKTSRSSIELNDGRRRDSTRGRDSDSSVQYAASELCRLVILDCTKDNSDLKTVDMGVNENYLTSERTDSQKTTYYGEVAASHEATGYSFLPEHLLSRRCSQTSNEEEDWKRQGKSIVFQCSIRKHTKL